MHSIVFLLLVYYQYLGFEVVYCQNIFGSACR
jgi:hypothetical protein